MPCTRLPTELKQLRGTYRPDRANPKEPKPPKQEPPMPRHLSPIGKKARRQACDLLSGMGVLTQADAFTVEALAEAYADLLTARAALAARGGLTYETVTPTGAVMVRPAPEVSMVADADKRLRAWLTACGLTPASRSTVNAAAADDELNEFAQFMN